MLHDELKDSLAFFCAKFYSDGAHCCSHKRKQAAKSHPNRTYYFRKPEAEDLNKLVQLSTRQLKSRPDNLKALHIRAMSRMKLGEFKAATQDYTAMLQYGGDNDVVTLYNRGCALEKSGRYEEAIADFTKVLQLDPAFAAGESLDQLLEHVKSSETMRVRALGLSAGRHSLKECAPVFLDSRIRARRVPKPDWEFR